MLHYEVHGDRGPFVLFVHGLLSSRTQWLNNLGAFTDAFRPVVVELLGHGRSPAPDDPAAYAPSAYAAYFEHIRQAVGADRWYVVGQSLGAALTLRYVLDFPDWVIAHVFTNTNAALAPPAWFERLRPAREQVVRDIETKGRAALESHPLNPARSRHLPADVREAFRRDFELHHPRGIALTMIHTSLACSVRGSVENNTVPTLMVVGRRETRFEDSRRYAERAIPHLSVLSLDVGHAVNIGAAAEFNEATLTFFSRHPAEGAHKSAPSGPP